MQAPNDDINDTRYNCICNRYGFGQPHLVSQATFFRHLREASSDDERARIQQAKLDHIPPDRRTTSRRARGIPPRRRNNILPAQKRDRDSDEQPEGSKRGRQSSPMDIDRASPTGPSHQPSPSRSPPASPLPSPPRSPPRSPPASPPRSPPRSPPHSPPHSPPGSPPRSPPRSPPQSPPPSPPRSPRAQHNAIVYERRQRPQVDIDELTRLATFKPMSDTITFIREIANASITDPVSKLSDAMIERLRNPPSIPLQIPDPGIRHSISTYLALEHASQDAYKRIIRSFTHNFSGTPGAGSIQSFQNVERLIATYTGVEAIQHDMCPRSCHAFTGPFANLDACYMCQAPRWSQQQIQGPNDRHKVPVQQFTTIPVGPQLQARFRSESASRAMRYLWERAQDILNQLRRPGSTGTVPIVDDIAAGWDFLGAVLDGDVKEHDIVLMVSLDGAQLYDSKESDCWIYIWIIVNLSPDLRYRKAHVLPGGFIPGPHKPKNVDSFLFPGFHHLAALQREGLPIWDALIDSRYISHPYLLFTTADGPGLVYWDGMVGHSGKNGCRVYCGLRGRHKDRGKYYPALLCPRDRPRALDDHDDIDAFEIPEGGSTEYAEHLKKIVSVSNQTQWDRRKTDTGLTKPPLILGLDPSHSLGIPLCMTTDIMHLAGNISDLLLELWRGSMDAGPNDDKSTWDWAVLRDKDTWNRHGELVEHAGYHLPGSFDRKPRNIAEKINTQYKTWEFQLYLLGYAPIFLYSLLPLKYWSNFCKLVRGFQIMCQHTITSQQLQQAHVLLCSWEREFKILYYQLRHDRLHFIRPSAHQVLHLVPEAIQKGPPICYAQWTMERTIGNLGQEIRQPSRPYANLAREGVRRCQVNALLSIIPELEEPPRPLPNTAIDLGEGFQLRRKRDKYSILPSEPDIVAAIQDFLPPGHIIPRIFRWARLFLPNGQTARTLWRESLKPLEQLRVSRNVKFILNDGIRVGEVQYFTQIAQTQPNGDALFKNVAIVRLYSEPDPDLGKLSFHVLAASTLLNSILVVDVKSIRSVVAMIPHKLTFPSGVEAEYFCMVEKPGLDISDLGVPYSLNGDDDDNAEQEDQREDDENDVV